MRFRAALCLTLAVGFLALTVAKSTQCPDACCKCVPNPVANSIVVVKSKSCPISSCFCPDRYTFGYYCEVRVCLCIVVREASYSPFRVSNLTDAALCDGSVGSIPTLGRAVMAPPVAPAPPPVTSRSSTERPTGPLVVSVRATRASRAATVSTSSTHTGFA